MAEPHVVSALKRKYAELKGELKFAPPPDTEPLVLAIRQVGCVLRMFSPDEDLTAIKPVRAYAGERHSWARTALDILRETGRPMSARELGRAVLAARGVPCRDRTLVSVECSLHAVLGRLEGRGIVREDGSPKRWRIA
jgi:hypothetical protein